LRGRALVGAVCLTALLSPRVGIAQYRLRADGYFAAADPVSGMIILSGESRSPTWLTGDTVVWLGAGGDKAGDVMVASVRAREPNGYGEARIGRMLVSVGALRPIHIDGADATARGPWGTSVEAFVGMPVVSNFQPRDYDWATGGRLAQRIGPYGTVGISYLQMRETGALSFEELGIDAALQPMSWLDAAFTGAVDLESLALADAHLSLAARFSTVRVELFAVRRSPSHLLPATSLFSALGDVPSERAGGSILWKPAPRLDLLGEGSAESLGGLLGAQALVRATLRLDDKGAGAVAVEGRRQSTPAASWTGVRGTARLPLSRLFTAATELELVAPDEARGRGLVWPWGLVALRFKLQPQWELAGAFEASASPTATSALSGLLRASYVWAHK
jgi:hypothetical protein